MTPTTSSLEQRVAALEEENARLRRYFEAGERVRFDGKGGHADDCLDDWDKAAYAIWDMDRAALSKENG